MGRPIICFRLCKQNPAKYSALDTVRTVHFMVMQVRAYARRSLSEKNRKIAPSASSTVRSIGKARKRISGRAYSHSQCCCCMPLCGADGVSSRPGGASAWRDNGERHVRRATHVPQKSPKFRCADSEKSADIEERTCARAPLMFDNEIRMSLLRLPNPAQLPAKLSVAAARAPVDKRTTWCPWSERRKPRGSAQMSASATWTLVYQRCS